MQRRRTAGKGARPNSTTEQRPLAAVREFAGKKNSKRWIHESQSQRRCRAKQLHVVRLRRAKLDCKWFRRWKSGCVMQACGTGEVSLLPHSSMLFYASEYVVGYFILCYSVGSSFQLISLHTSFLYTPFVLLTLFQCFSFPLPIHKHCAQAAHPANTCRIFCTRPSARTGNAPTLSPSPA